MDFPLLLPGFCRGYGKRKREVAGAQRGARPICLEERSGNGEAVAVG